jgi:hypothetical protein
MKSDYLHGIRWKATDLRMRVFSMKETQTVLLYIGRRVVALTG